MAPFSHSELETKSAELEETERMHSERLVLMQAQHAGEQQASSAALREAESRLTQLSNERAEVRRDNCNVSRSAAMPFLLVRRGRRLLTLQ
jgi:Tfp pilus assembly protein PilX